MDTWTLSSLLLVPVIPSFQSTLLARKRGKDIGHAVLGSLCCNAYRFDAFACNWYVNVDSCKRVAYGPHLCKADSIIKRKCR